MGVIVTEHYVCDFCSKPIEGDRTFTGHLELRKPGARGRGREVKIMLHSDCADLLTQVAVPVPQKARTAG